MPGYSIPMLDIMSVFRYNQRSEKKNKKQRLFKKKKKKKKNRIRQDKTRQDKTVLSDNCFFPKITQLVHYLDTQLGCQALILKLTLFVVDYAMRKRRRYGRPIVPSWDLNLYTQVGKTTMSVLEANSVVHIVKFS